MSILRNKQINKTLISANNAYAHAPVKTNDSYKYRNLRANLNAAAMWPSRQLEAVLVPQLNSLPSWKVGSSINIELFHWMKVLMADDLISEFDSHLYSPQAMLCMYPPTPRFATTTRALRTMHSNHAAHYRLHLLVSLLHELDSCWLHTHRLPNSAPTMLQSFRRR